MKKLLLLLCCSAFLTLKAQDLYFPPVVNSLPWDTLSLNSLGWCESEVEELYNFLDINNSKAFIVLKDGKIVLEKYFDSFTKDSIWYWASAGKTITALTIGKAQEENYLDISDPTSDYLGMGWTSTTASQELAITIWHQLTMTSGLEDDVNDFTCTLPSCLTYNAAPGTRWAYHNGPYTLLDEVVTEAVGVNINLYFANKIGNQIGMSGLFYPLDYNNVYFSTPRSMAKFGLLMLNKGKWDETVLFSDSTYFENMITTSQDINLAYGYLWWLNGKTSFHLPSSQIEFSGTLMPAAPEDMYAALGKNGQIINVVPSQNLVVIRMGEAPDASITVPVSFNDEIWEKLNAVICNTSPVENIEDGIEWSIYPNPSQDFMVLDGLKIGTPLTIYDALGKSVLSLTYQGDKLDIRNWPKGIYTISIDKETRRMIKQ